MFESLTQHQFWLAAAIYWIFSAAVGSLPFPADNGSPGYIWVYRFCHTLAGNLNTVFAGRSPGLKTLVLLLALPFMLATSACSAHYTLHPGALSKADSTAYDTLFVAEAAIDQARTEYAAGRLPDGVKEPLNALIRSYNVARDSWLTYRGAIATNVPTQTYFDQLTKNLSDLTSAIRNLQEAK